MEELQHHRQRHQCRAGSQRNRKQRQCLSPTRVRAAGDQRPRIEADDPTIRESPVAVKPAA